MKFQENKSIVDEEEESFRAIFPRGSRWLGLGRSGCKVAARRRRRSKFASPAGGGGKEQDRMELTYYPKGIRTLLGSSNSSLLSSLLYLSLSELAVETAIIKLWSRS